MKNLYFGQNTGGLPYPIGSSGCYETGYCETVNVTGSLPPSFWFQGFDWNFLWGNPAPYPYTPGAGPLFHSPTAQSTLQKLKQCFSSWQGFLDCLKKIKFTAGAPSGFIPGSTKQPQGSTATLPCAFYQTANAGGGCGMNPVVIVGGIAAALILLSSSKKK